MAETYKLTQKDVEIIGWYPEATKGTSVTSTTFKPLRMILQNCTIRVDKGRQEHWRDGTGPIESDQTIGQERVTGTITGLLETDYVSGDAATISFLALAMGTNSLHTATGRILMRGTKYITFTSGASGLVVGKTLTGASSSATAIIKEVLIATGTLVGGNATGTLVIDNITGTFQSSENLQIGGATKAVSAAANTEVKSELDSFTLWLKQKSIAFNHSVTGCSIKSLRLSGQENGNVELSFEFSGQHYAQAAPGTSNALPTAHYYTALSYFQWTNSMCTSMTLTRTGTEARLRSWELNIDNGDLHFIPKDGQAYACDYVPGKLGVGGKLEFYVNDTEVYTVWNTDPNTAKTLAYDAQSGNFTAGLYIKGETSGATALIVSDSDAGTTGTLTIRDIKGVFQNDEVITDSSTGSATVNGTLADTGTIDFSIVLSKNSAADYLSISCYNIVPTGNMEISHNPQSDEMWMINYPFKVLRNGNFKIDVKG